MAHFGGEVLSQAQEGHVEFRWTASHIDEALCEDATEEYLAVWNDVVDQQAVYTNLERGASFRFLFEAADKFYRTWASRIDAQLAF